MNETLPYEIIDYNTYVLAAYVFAGVVLAIVVANSIGLARRYRVKLEDMKKLP